MIDSVNITAMFTSRKTAIRLNIGRPPWSRQEHHNKYSKEEQRCPGLGGVYDLYGAAQVANELVVIGVWSFLYDSVFVVFVENIVRDSDGDTEHRAHRSNR